MLSSLPRLPVKVEELGFRTSVQPLPDSIMLFTLSRLVDFLFNNHRDRDDLCIFWEIEGLEPDSPYDVGTKVHSERGRGGLRRLPHAIIVEVRHQFGHLLCPTQS